MTRRSILLLILLLAVLGGTSSTALGSTTASPAGRNALSKHDVLSWPLVALIQTTPQPSVPASIDAQALPKALRDLISADLMRIDQQGRVQVFIQTDAGTAFVVPALAAAGADVEREAPEIGIVQAWLPPQAIVAIASTPGVTNVRLPDYGVRSIGSVTTEGDALLSADAARAAKGIDGSGIRVGVISDGVEGLAASQASGDLPAVNRTTCNMVAQSATATDAGGEGTAMLEIVYDLAPGAELWFGHFGFSFTGTSLDFMAAVNCLAQHVDVVVDDIGWLNVGPYDGTSSVSLNASNTLSDPSNRIRGYYNAVGNFARNHYEGAYIDSGSDHVSGLDVWDLQLFVPNAETTDAGISPACACTDAMRLAPGGTVTIRVQWDDPFGASSNDYDLFLFEGINIVAVGGDPQDGNDDPTEFLAYTNETGGTQLLDLAIGNFNGTAAARTFDLFVSCTPGDCQTLANGAIHNYNTRCSSIVNNSDAGGGVVSLGAIFSGDPGLDSVEPFSSCGPTNDGRIKPDVAAVDGVSVTGNGGFSSTFFGTSAAAPHAAGVAALLLDCHGGLSQDALRMSLLTTAVDIGAPGEDNEFGYGRIHALSAVQQLTCGPAMSLEAPGIVPVGQTFLLVVNTSPAPDVALSGFATEILLPEGLTWEQRPTCEDEVQARRIDQTPLALCAQFVTGVLGGAGHSVVSELGGLPLAALDVPAGGTVPLIELDVTCAAAGVYTVTLTSLQDSLFGAAYFDVSANEVSVATLPLDYDGDTVSNAVASAITVDCSEVLDSDQDGCTDTQELGPDELFGGRRDPFFFWDFFDPNRDRSVTTLDFFALLARFGSVGDSSIDPLSEPPAAPAYHPRFDRTAALPGANVWEIQPADGAIALVDFFALLGQFGHSCG